MNNNYKQTIGTVIEEIRKGIALLRVNWNNPKALWEVELIRYLAVGVSGVAVDAVLYVILLQFITNISICKGISIVISVVYAFFAYSWVTFKSKVNIGILLRYIAVYAISIVMNILINRTINNALGGTSAAILIAYLTATGASVMLNYSLFKVWVFSIHSTPK